MALPQVLHGIPPIHRCCFVKRFVRVMSRVKIASNMQVRPRRSQHAQTPRELFWRYCSATSMAASASTPASFWEEDPSRSGRHNCYQLARRSRDCQRAKGPQPCGDNDNQVVRPKTRQPRLSTMPPGWWFQAAVRQHCVSTKEAQRKVRPLCLLPLWVVCIGSARSSSANCRPIHRIPICRSGLLRKPFP